ncbi:EamA family transporter [Egibacter rhizosphaerae]|uniref:EamA family transporter n=1 Tax=Egibacter rhizosphaerae TaxID=1670831 RepID=A0A411YHG2_9ACTN|nr:DMT family transporter [Egibacter rhizosphaerae]QBI20680.1 EamA family transporter [Egibacter rhizosphaerae]
MSEPSRGPRHTDGREASSARDTPPGPRPLGGTFVLAGAILWGTAGAAVALGPSEATTWQVALARLGLGAGLLLLLAAATGRLGGPPRPLRAAVAAAAALAVFQAGYFTAIDRAGVALGTVVAIGSSPILAGVVERVALGVRPERRWWPATALAVLGLALLLGADLRAETGDALGIVAGLIAGLGFAGFAVASRRLSRGAGDPAARMGWLLAGAAIVFAPAAVGITVAAGDSLEWAASPPGLAMLGWLAVGATAVAYWLFGRGIARVPAATAATLVLAEPLTATALGVGVLAERPVPVQIVGALLVLAALVTLSVRRPTARGAEADDPGQPSEPRYRNPRGRG